MWSLSGIGGGVEEALRDSVGRLLPSGVFMPADGASLRARLSLPLLVFLAVVGYPCRQVLFVN